jgi:hypothetical protein
VAPDPVAAQDRSAPAQVRVAVVVGAPLAPVEAGVVVTQAGVALAPLAQALAPLAQVLTQAQAAAMRAVALAPLATGVTQEQAAAPAAELANSSWVSATAADSLKESATAEG